MSFVRVRAVSNFSAFCAELPTTRKKFPDGTGVNWLLLKNFNNNGTLLQTMYPYSADMA